MAGGLALVIGAVLAMGRLAPNLPTRLTAGTWVELWRATPLLLLIYFINLSFPSYGIDLPVFWFLVIGLTVYNSAVFAETFRTGVVSLHRGQREAAQALGLIVAAALVAVAVPAALTAFDDDPPPSPPTASSTPSRSMPSRSTPSTDSTGGGPSGENPLGYTTTVAADIP
nr:ABC transporter permease subunit [Micromonospora sp. DSM 115978]